MRAVVVERFGGPEVLATRELPDPVATEGKVLVAVKAANINPTDLAARQGFMVGSTVEPPFILGWDFAGEVVDPGSSDSGLAAGDRVVGMIPWYAVGGTCGAYCELLAVDPSWLVRTPAGLEDALAATIPLNALTAYQALQLLAPEPGTRLLVNGASGSVGGFAAQLATASGCQVTALASRGDEEWVRGLGVASVLPRDADLSALPGFPSVFDAVPLGEPALAALLDDGAVVATRPTPPADPARRIRQEMVLIRSDHDALATLVAEVAAGRLVTRVDRTMALEDAPEAHRLVVAGGLRGKIILVP